MGIDKLPFGPTTDLVGKLVQEATSRDPSIKVYKPETLQAGAYYLLNLEATLEEVKEKYGVSEPTVTRRYRDILRAINREDLIKFYARKHRDYEHTRLEEEIPKLKEWIRKV